MKPYYQDDMVTLYHGDSMEHLATLDDSSFDCVITDPPYTEEVHANARSSKGNISSAGAIDFEHFTDDLLDHAFEEMGRVSKRWVISTLAWQQAFRISQNSPTTLDFKRLGVWVKTTYAPQVLADRPSSAWEAIVYLHKAGQISSWNGGGKHGNYVGNIAKPNGHPTAKPVELINFFVEMFTNHGDSILDPFAGSGTTLLAARTLGRKAVGYEMSEKYCELAASRLDQQMFDFGGI